MEIVTSQAVLNHLEVMAVDFDDTVCRKPYERVSPILFTLTSRSDSNFECSNISLKENKRDGVDLNSNDLDYCVQNNERKFLWFSADWIKSSEIS